MTAWSARYFLESIYTSATCLILYLHGLLGGLNTTILSQNIVGLVRNSHEREIDAIVAALTGNTIKMTSPSLTHCGRVTQISVFNTVNLGKSASSP